MYVEILSSSGFLLAWVPNYFLMMTLQQIHMCHLQVGSLFSLLTFALLTRVVACSQSTLLVVSRQPRYSICLIKHLYVIFPRHRIFFVVHQTRLFVFDFSSNNDNFLFPHKQQLYYISPRIRMSFVAPQTIAVFYFPLKNVCFLFFLKKTTAFISSGTTAVSF